MPEKERDWHEAALDNDAKPGKAIPEYVVRAAMQVRDYLDEAGMTRLAGLQRATWCEAPAETKRLMQDDAPPERPMNHWRPFAPGDKVTYKDVDGNRLSGKLLRMESDRQWLVAAGSHGVPQLVHEDILTLVRHADGEAPNRQRERYSQPHLFQIRGHGQLWKEAYKLYADTIIRQGGFAMMAINGRVLAQFIEDDVEIKLVTGTTDDRR